MILCLATRAMGTRFELVLIGKDEVHLRAAGEEALAEIEECDRGLSLFRKDSMVSHLNRCAVSDWTRVDRDTFELLGKCALLHAATEGGFDPTIAPLMHAHGFRGSGSGTDLETARASVGWEHVELDPDRCAVRFRHSYTAIDLGAIGKGCGLDRAALSLGEAGVSVALLHGGTSTCLAIGTPPGESGWRVSIGPGDRSPVATLRDCALSVSAQSGPMARSRPGHVLDPRVGSPASGPSAAAVIARDATTADAWSTALLVRGDLRSPDIEITTAKGDPEQLHWNEPVPSGGCLALDRVVLEESP